MSAAETQMDLDRITHPLRLARGSHQPGSGKGCAMNAISYINGDEHITDFPTCSARSLAILDIAELHRQAARGDMPAIAAWDAADRAARAADRPASPTSNAAGAFAPGRIRVDHTRQRASLSVDAGRRDRIRRARPHAGRRGHRRQSRGGAGQAGDPLLASPRRAEQLGQRSDIGRQSAQSGFAG